MKLARLCSVIAAGLVVLSTAAACANGFATGSSRPSAKGLLISPAIAFDSINAGSQQTKTLTIADSTSSSLTVNLSVKQFSVNSYSYTYNFNPPQKDWINLSQTAVVLSPGQSRLISYQIKVPASAPPGGNYYTLIASSSLSSGAIQGTVQAASLLYLTVNGHLVRSAWVSGNSMQTFVFGKQVNYHFNVTDSGNVYYFIYVSGKLHGLGTGKTETAAAHIVMPGKVRSFSGVVASPVLPGVYRATYGFTTDAGASQTESHWIVYLPPWSIAALLFILLGLNLWYNRRHR